MVNVCKHTKLDPPPQNEQERERTVVVQYATERKLREKAALPKTKQQKTEK